MQKAALRDSISGKFRLISVEGPIGVGKTTLAKRASELLGFTSVLDAATPNPLLKDFYANMEKLAFPTQVQFVVNRSRLWKQAAGGKKEKVATVTDFLPERDLVFADTNLKGPEVPVFRDLYSALFADLPQPDAIIYLTADTDVLIERIARRGIAYEGRITRKYLQDISDRFHRYFLSLEGKPVLVVNTNDQNIVESEESVRDIFAQLLNTRMELQYYVPPDHRRT
jgi:deoxyadenosine/deoxycytidine kinase